MLRGREIECAAIDRLLDDARSGASGALVLRGATGIGKSALLEYAIASAQDLAVSRVAGIESELALGFAGVHQLVLPFLDRLGELPVPQRHALESVFGLAEHDRPDLLVVGLATLTLVDNVARDVPLLLVIDDAQWLDDESRSVASFVARRLHADRVAMLFAVREPAPGAAPAVEGLRELEVSGLSADAAREFLGDVAPAPIGADVLERLIDATRGNPLALGEFVQVLSAEQLRGDAPLPDPLPIGPSLRDRFISRARHLPLPGRTLLLLASAERTGDPSLVQRAASAMGVPWDEAIASIEAEGLATFTPTVRFRHPLVRSAAYHGATAAERRDVHRALADALEADGDSDRSAWHLAAGASTPDEDVACALELAGRRMFHRGGTQAAAEFLLRASELTPDPILRTDRMLEAVRLRSAAGDAARAQPLLDFVLRRVDSGRQRAEAEYTQGLIWLEEGRGHDATRALARAVASIDGCDDAVALDALITAENAAIYVGSLRESTFVENVAAAARRVLPERLPHTAIERLTLAIAILLADGYGSAAPTISAALGELRRRVEVSGLVLEAYADEDANMRHLLAVNAACALVDYGALQAATRSWVEFGRRTRSLTTLPIALDLLCVAEVLAGRFRAAEAAIAEADDMLSFAASRGHIGEAGVGRLFLHAFRGDEDKTRATADLRSRDALERGSGGDLDLSHYALAVLDLGSASYASALEHCRRIDAHASVPLAGLVLPLLIEAATRCGEVTAANDALDRFARRAAAAGSDWACGLLACSRALLATDDDAEAQYREAVDLLSRSGAAFDAARARLLFGEWLRRTKRRRDARELLRAAHKFFEDAGSQAFAERARVELEATGEHAHRRSDASRYALTPQEEQIARLVAEGCANSEIASRLYLSRSTVEYHLRKIYRKAGVTTRTQLARLELVR